MVSILDQSQCHSKSSLLAFRFSSNAEAHSPLLVARSLRELPQEYQMDSLLRECFMKAVCSSASKTVVMSTPLKGSKVYTDYMRPSRPEGSSLDVKVSSFKTLRSFLEQLEAEGLLTLEPCLSDPVVKEIHYDHPDFGVDLPEPKTKKAVSLTATTLELRPIGWRKDSTQNASTISEAADTVSTA